MFLYLGEPLQRFENTVRTGGTWELQQQHKQQHSGCVEGDLTEFQEDNSTSNCSSQVWSELGMLKPDF